MFVIIQIFAKRAISLLYLATLLHPLAFHSIFNLKLGDVLGPSMHNLHQLLHMPVGCGEQVMSAFAPDIFVANYLTATNQLTSDIKDRALIYMEKGKHKIVLFVVISY